MTLLARVPLRVQRFPKANNKELVRLVESAPALMRMSGTNGTLDIKVRQGRRAHEARGGHRQDKITGARLRENCTT